MESCSFIRLSRSIAGWPRSYASSGQFGISCRPINSTTPISASGRKKAFPEAIAWASPRVRQRAQARQIYVDFARDLDLAPPQEWCRDIDQTLFPGGYFKEFIFFHLPSKTLILTDTIINIEPDRIGAPWRAAVKLTGMAAPHGGIFFGMQIPLILQQRAAKAARTTIYLWQPQRIVLSHGRCFDAGADRVIERIFGPSSA